MSLREDAELLERTAEHFETHDAARRLLAAIEGAEVMWRVRYAGGGPSSVHSHKESALFRATRDEKCGHRNAIVERVLVIREDLE